MILPFWTALGVGPYIWGCGPSRTPVPTARDSRSLRQGSLRRAEHILNENAVAGGGIVDEHVRDRADRLAVLNDGAA